MNANANIPASCGYIHLIAEQYASASTNLFLFNIYKPILKFLLNHMVLVLLVKFSTGPSQKVPQKIAAEPGTKFALLIFIAKYKNAPIA